MSGDDLRQRIERIRRNYLGRGAAMTLWHEEMNFLCDECERRARIADEIERLQKERDALRAFAQGVLAPWPEGSLDGFDLQDLAERHGLLQRGQCLKRTSLLTGMEDER